MGKHLTMLDRQTVEQMLNDKQKITDIAKTLGKSVSAISREVRSKIVKRRTGGQGFSYNNCKKRKECTKSHVCVPCKANRRQTLCRRCNACNNYCPDYQADTCELLLKPPYVCNGCGMRIFCSLEKSFYFASTAEQKYREILSGTRTGTSYAEEEIDMLDKLISPLVKKGQSPHFIYAENKDSIMVSERTIYNLINTSAFSARNLDLPRRVRFKPRKKKVHFKVDKTCRIGRDYACFQKYLEEHPDTPVIELDSVEGKKGGKVLLTIHFVKCEMMLAFLRNSNTAQSVIDIFDSLYEGLGRAPFCSIFHLLLGDNGSEFSDPLKIEFDKEGNRRTILFYCDPNAPYQKGSAERNHEFIRCFIPKGIDMGIYTQNDITLMMNHINSYSRKSLGDKCPYEVFRYFYGDDLLKLLNCEIIPPRDITLNKSIFKEKPV